MSEELKRLIASILMGLALVVPSKADAADFVVFAAASLKTALDEVVLGFEEATGKDVAVSYAGTSALARQIDRGAPADVFISANPEWMDFLGAAGLIDEASREDLLGNTLVLVEHGRGAIPVDLTDPIPGEGRLAMALVDAVPAGIYGKAALTSLGLWEASKGRVVQTDNVRSALLLVSRGEATFGLVYATDVVPEAEVTIVAEFPKTSHPPITYPIALTRRADPEAVALFDHLTAPSARAVFASHGFRVPG